MWHFFPDGSSHLLCFVVHEGGIAHALSWCPCPPVRDDAAANVETGMLAVACADGRVRVLAVPAVVS